MAAPDLQPSAALAAFHPRTRAWFAQAWPAPTPAQALAWPAIAAGEHVLVSAPTGSGKTLTAFLWALDGFHSGRLACGATRVLYVSPLKALNNDIQRNLLAPLAALEQCARDDGQQPPQVRVATRSGDTPANERQRLLRRPPEILVTTPESLNLMLSTRRGRAALAEVETLVLDEVHALAADRRGTHLATAVERLEWLVAEARGSTDDVLQRIALSATVRPLATIAAFVGGQRADGSARPVQVLEAPGQRTIELAVQTPDDLPAALERGEPIWPSVAAAIRTRIRANQATLVFANSRALTEKITALVNDGEQLAWSHHGSLSREIRAAVEARLKAGRLPAIVATSSLEMGIDIGTLDEVVMVQAPGSVAATLQRIGRAGHQVGATSRAVLFPSHAADQLSAAVLAEAVAERAIEAIQPPEQPLDVLAQVLVSLTASDTWPLDQLYAQICCAWPYRHLPRPLFDLVLDMLAGRWQDTRLPALTPRLAVDREQGTASARRSAVLALYGAGGTIPDRGYYQLRHAGSGARIGELDEEFVWEARPGQVFTLGAQRWQVQRITHNDVLVQPASGSAAAPPPPFWRSEEQLRSWHLAQRQAIWLEDADQALAAGDRTGLEQRLDAAGFDQSTRATLLAWLQRQRAHTGAPLPHRHLLLAEQTSSAPRGHHSGAAPGQLVLHTQWGGRVNQPLALLLAGVLDSDHGLRVDTFANDDAVALVAAEPVPAACVHAALLSLAADPQRIESLLRERLEGSGFFGARFRECAGRALLLNRGRVGQRLPLWLARQQAGQLLERVRALPDFPITLEAWRACLQDSCDLTALGELLGELAAGQIAWQAVATPAPSPFAATLDWDQVNRLMYADDTPAGTGSSSQLAPDLLRLVLGSGERPLVPQALVADYLARRRRLAPGYAPAPGIELREWVREQLCLEATAWEALQAAVARDHPDSAPIDDPGLLWLELPQGRWLLQRQDAAALASLPGVGDAARWTALDGSPASSPGRADRRDSLDLLAQWLPFQGPASLDQLRAAWPGHPDSLPPDLEQLADEDRVLHGSLVADRPPLWCDRDGADALLRMARAARRPDLAPQPVTALACFSQAWHQLDAGADLEDHLERLRLLPVPLARLERDWLPARQPEFRPADLDQLLARGDWLWVGRGQDRLLLATADDLALLTPPDAPPAVTLPHPLGRFPTDVLLGGGASRAALAADVWAGHLGLDQLDALRHGRLDPTTAEAPPAADRGRPGRLGRRRTRTRSVPGHWFALPWPDADPTDALDQLELARERARVLLDRHGIVCREVAAREAPEFLWSGLFTALRGMELAGEVQGGLFFADLSGPQFARPAAWRLLADLAGREPGTTVHWLAATDPAAPCGLGLAWPGDLALPARRDGNYLVFSGAQLLATVQGRGQRLAFALPADDPRAAAVLGVLGHLLQHERRLTLDSINGRPPADSPWLEALSSVAAVHRDHRGVVLERRTP